MVDIIFKDIENIPVYQFDFPAMLFSLGIFIAVYELVMFIYTQKAVLKNYYDGLKH